ncbi:MAG: hypothetical protein ACLFST_09435 [Spirochaetia bacterium]
MKEKKIRPLTIMIAAIAVGFLMLTGHQAYQEALNRKEFIMDREIPAMGLAAAAKLDAAAGLYLQAGEDLLRDDFLVDWILQGEENVPVLTEFMEKIRSRHGAMNASMVSDISETYYDSAGTVLPLSRNNWERDGWYYLFREKVSGINIDSWYFPENGRTEIYINIPLTSSGGSFLGLAGCGFEIQDFSSRFLIQNRAGDLSFYILRLDGRLVYSDDHKLLAGNSPGLPESWRYQAMESIRRQGGNSAGTVVDLTGTSGGIIWGTYLDNWKSYLLVQRDTPAVKAEMWHAAERVVIEGGLLALFFLTAAFIVLKISYNRIILYVQRLQINNRKQNAVLYHNNRLLEDMELHHLPGEEKFYRERKELDRLLKKPENLLRQTFSLNDLVHEVILNLRVRISVKNILLHTDLDSTALTVTEGNESLTRIVITDLLCRIISVTKENGNIQVRTQKTDTGCSVEFSLESPVPEDDHESISADRTVTAELGGNLTVMPDRRTIRLQLPGRKIQATEYL